MNESYCFWRRFKLKKKRKKQSATTNDTATTTMLRATVVDNGNDVGACHTY